MMRAILILSLLALAGTGPARAQSLWPEKDDRKARLVEDRVAVGRGDILTILVKETTKVANQDASERKQSSSLDAKIEALGVAPKAFAELPTIKGSVDRATSGSANVTRDDSLETRIAVTVVDVRPNGNLVVEGRRTVLIDQDRKTAVITGVVRPLDLTSANVVLSENVADADVKVESEGPSAEATERGFLKKVVDFLVHHLWPF